MRLPTVRPAAWGIAAVAVAGLLAVAAAGRPTGSKGEALAAVVDVSPAAVRRVAVEAGGRQALLTRDGRGWGAEPGTPPQSAPLLFSAEDDLFPMLAYRVLEADPADPQYGLVHPAAVVRISDDIGRWRGIRFGSASFSGAGFYAGQDGDARRVYLVPRSTVDVLRSLVTGERATSADSLQDRAGRYQAERDEAERSKDVPVYLRQVLESGGQPPPPAP